MCILTYQLTNSCCGATIRKKYGGSGNVCLQCYLYCCAVHPLLVALGWAYIVMLFLMLLGTNGH